MKVTASLSNTIARADGQLPDWIQYLPPGENQIDATVDGKPERITVIADAAAAQALQADLRARLHDPAEPDPFMGFDHVDGPASGWPEEFRWNGERGIEVRPRWSSSGAAGVVAAEGADLPDYRYFSPTFRWDRDTRRVLGLLPRQEVGSLVNNPAFRRIARVAAADNLSAPAETTKQTPSMNKLEDILAVLVKAGILTAEEAAGDTAGAIIESKMAEKNSAVACSVTTATELGSVKASLATAQAELKSLREKTAGEKVAAAVTAGKLPARDKATHEWWTEQLATDTTGKAVAALNALVPIRPAPSGATPPGGDSHADDSHSAAEKARVARVSAKARELQSANPKKAWADCWAMAESAVTA